MVETPTESRLVGDGDDPHDVVRRLNEALGATLVAVLAGATSREQAANWAHADAPEPMPEMWNRLQRADQIWSMLESKEGRDVARRWFIGANPRFDGSTPVMAIRNDRHTDVRRAAQAFIDGDVDE